MDSFDKKIKNAFNQTDNIPEGYNWSDMESSILKKMEEPNNTKIGYWRTIALTAAAITFFIAISFVIYNNELDKTDTPHNEMKLQAFSNKTNSKKTRTSIEEKTIDKKIDTDGSSSDYYTSNLSKNYPKNPKEKESNKIEYVVRNNDKKTSNLSSINNSDKTPETQNLSSKLENFQFSEEEKEISSIDQYQLVLQQNTPSNQEPKLNNIDINSISTKNQVSPIEKIQTKKQYVHTSNNKLDVTDINLYYISPNISVSQKDIAPNSYAIELSSGINNWFSNYEDNTLLTKYESKQLGYSNRLNLIKTTTNWDLKAGYEHQYLRSLIDYKEDYLVPVKFENVVVEIVSSAYERSSGVEKYGDTIVMRQRSVDIVNYNNIRSHSLNLGVARKIQLNPKLKLNINLGASYSIKTIAKGVSLNRNDKEYRIYNYKLNNSIGISTGIGLSYSITPEYSIISNLTVQKMLGKWSIDSYKISSPTIVGIGLGVRYSL